jgi:arylsulfatase A-like enzyme
MKQLIIAVLILKSSFLIAQNSPNIVLILIDDMSWNETQVQMDLNYPNSGSDFYLTPNISQLAQQGMTFSQGYAPAPKCSPTRQSILTGQSTARTGFTTTSSAIDSTRVLYSTSSRTKIKNNETTIAEKIKSLDNNYLAAHYGKWHLKANGPANHGFDRSDGNTDNADGVGTTNNPKKVFSLTDSAVAFMQDAVQANRPFYLQLSHYAIHSVFESTPSSFTTFSNLTPGTNHSEVLTGAMISDLDNSIATVMNEITNLGLTNNTYIIFTSDNGSGSYNTNIPLKMGKLFLNEGGVRVPYIFIGPNIPANTRSSIPVIGYDLFPTFVEWIAGNTSSISADIDGKSLVPILQNNSMITRTEPIVFHSPNYVSGRAEKNPRSAIVDDNYKLIVNYETGDFELFDLNNDIGETTNLFAANPSIGNALCLQLRDYLKSVSAAMPSLNPQFITNPGPANDLDNDGLDDEWEFRELLTTKYGANDNPDGDGFTNLEEFTNNTDPYDFTNSTNNVAIEKEIKVFPNPVNNHLTIEVKMAAFVQIFNVNGQLIQNLNINSSEQINTENWAKGIYFVQVQTDDDVRSFKILK